MASLKPVREQVVCVMGASSGIGRATALSFAARGARVAAAARGSRGLAALVDDIRRQGGEAFAETCDVLNFDQVKRFADLAAARYGRIDTWVHLAAVSIYATFERTTPAEFKQVIDVNLTGQAYGAMAALPHLRREGRGALVHVSSIEARRAFPYQSAYAASKHGIKGFLEALRTELEHEDAGITVSEILPSSINTPFFEKARSRLGVQPKGVPPFYSPHLVARAILHAATTGVPEIMVGGAGAALALSECVSPRLTDRIVGLIGFKGQRTRKAKPESGPDNLFQSLDRVDGAEGPFAPAARSSAYTWLQMHPGVKPLLASVAIGLAACWASGWLRKR